MPTASSDGEAPLLVFDTDCVLCSRGVTFVLSHERDHDLRFVSAWSPAGLALAGRHGFTRSDLEESFLFVGEGNVLTKSDAALAVARHLTRPVRWLGLLKLVPKPARDTAYSFIARRRYRWFGRHPGCFVAPPDMRERFIGLDPPAPV